MIGSGLLGGSYAMAKAMAGDVARSIDPLGVVDGALPDDWLDARDPDYIERALPAIRAWSEHYFRAEVEGLEHIPADEPALLVGNHSGGTLIADTFVFAQHFYDHFGSQRRASSPPRGRGRRRPTAGPPAASDRRRSPRRPPAT